LNVPHDEEGVMKEPAKKSVKPMKLSKETVRQLTDPELQKAQGGRFVSHVPCENTIWETCAPC
jgi:hypothetical protein